MEIQIYFQNEFNKTLEFSANEAAAYLHRMMPDSRITINNKIEGIHFDLSIALEASPVPSDLDGFSIQITPDSGSIRGENDRSVLMGVYYYLYLLGCRFLGPDKECELVPLLENPALLYQSCSKTARVMHRGVCLEGADSKENILSFIDWLPKAGFNSFFLQFKLPYSFLARWYHHELNALSAPEPFTPADAAKLTEDFSAELKKRGLLLHQAGHGWTGESVGYSSIDWKESPVPPTEKQLDMMAELNGNRGLFHGIPMNTNLCYANPGVIESFAGSVAEYAGSHRDADYLHVWLADEYNNVCECEDCKKTTLPDQYIHILNRIDRKLEEKGLDTKIVFLLYQELLWPPKETFLLHPERFVLMFAPISRTFDASYKIPDTLPPIPEYRRNRITLPSSLDENLAFLRAWQKLFAGDSFIYDYPLGRAHYGDFGYLHIAEIISEDIGQLDCLGLNGYMSCQELRCGAPNFLPNYIMGRMLFDAECSFKELTEEYFSAAYGKNAGFVLQYLTALSDLCSCDYFNGKGSRISPCNASRMTQALSLTEAFRDARKALDTPDSPTEKLFQKLLDYHEAYIILLEKALCLLASGKSDEAQRFWEEFQNLVSAHELEFQPFLDVYRITEVSSKYTGFRLTDPLKRTL